MASRATTATFGLLVSIGVSIVLWDVFETLLVFLFIPFVPFVFGRGREEHRETRRCPNCDFTTDDPAVEYCPYDGARLEQGY